MSDPLHILVVDDEPRFRTMVRRYLVSEGFKVTEAADGAALREALARETVNLILLDLNLPREDGLSLARELRRGSAVPIIMLTGKGDLIDRVAGLETGADDYMTKPFEPRELLARIRTVMRRAQPTASATTLPAPPSDEDVLAFEGWRLDLIRRQLTRLTGETVPLTASEFDLLCCFARHPNRVLGRDQLLDLLRGADWSAYDRAIDMQVRRLRKRIEADPGNPALIKTVRGGGYIFAASVKSL